MSYAQRKANWAWGITSFLSKQGYKVNGPGHRQNKIVVQFLKEKGLPYHKWNWKYKGLNDAFQINAETIQENWNDFATWAIKNKPIGAAVVALIVGAI